MFFRKHRVSILIVAVLVLVAAWYAFRPEKLFINHKVDEAAPTADTGQPKLLLTTLLTGDIHKTAGRASVYKLADGSMELRLTNFSTSNGPDVHVLLAAAADPALAAKTPGLAPQDPVELGPLKGNQGDQNYPIAAGTDLAKDDAVVIYCERFHAVFGSGRLQAY